MVFFKAWYFFEAGCANLRSAYHPRLKTAVYPLVLSLYRLGQLLARKMALSVKHLPISPLARYSQVLRFHRATEAKRQPLAYDFANSRNGATVQISQLNTLSMPILVHTRLSGPSAFSDCYVSTVPIDIGSAAASGVVTKLSAEPTHSTKRTGGRHCPHSRP